MNNSIGSIIKESKRTQDTTLILSGKELTTVPEEIFELEHLLKLDLSNNQLMAIPAAMSRLGNLQSLILSKNQLSSLPREISKLKNLRVLHINSNKLSMLHEEFSQLRMLEDFRFDDNNLSTIPRWISRLVNLRILRLGRSRVYRNVDIPVSSLEWISQRKTLEDLNLANLGLKMVPDWLSEFTNLSRLSLYGNHLTSIPGWLIKLDKLSRLNLGHNQLRSFPKVVLQLRKLEFLNLDDNQIKAIPDDISNLTELISLQLYRTEISSLPPAFVHLKKLRQLLLWNCKFRSFPAVLYEIPTLENVSFDNESTEKSTRNNNQITEISSKILNLKNLKVLNLNGNPIQSPPPEVAARGVGAIRQYFIDLVEGEDHLFEAKLLIVGEPAAGKTTLAKKILNPAYELQSHEETTEGIEVTQWFFDDREGHTFRVNIWDFGGQEIYHATHQFFLTKRSVYALIADTRKDDTDFHYWLNIVELLSNASPLLIIKNEKQDRHREINERSLRSEFSHLQKIVATNLATNRELPQVIEEIKHLISHLPHIGTPLPKRWVSVRERLEAEARDYISVDEFLNICHENGFKDIEGKLRLSDYLHDLGVCLHFQEDPLLKKIVILKPKWGTDAVYKVLDNKDVIRNLGRFTKQDLKKIWGGKEFENMQDELLQLMINFRLCYRINNDQFYIAPQLLSGNQMYYEWNDEDNLSIRFDYEFMPKGILTQFIVVMHQLILKQKYVWKSGVILEKDKAKAEVIEYYNNKQIRIRVSGSRKKDLLTIVIYELEKIHKTYQRLKYQTLIACNCAKCVGTVDPHLYTLETLMTFIEDRQETIQCQKSYKMINVRGLIDEVIDKSRPVYNQEDKHGNINFQGPVETVVIKDSRVRGDRMSRKVKNSSTSPSSWLERNGLYIGAGTLVFMMLLVILSIFGYEVSDRGKFACVSVLALGSAFAAAAFTGRAALSGEIPFVHNQRPLIISATGGFATFIIVFVFGYWLYIK